MADGPKLTPFDTNDHWTLDIERLGMKPAGDRLWRLVLHCEPPYAICVQGKWGSGKTSVMRYAMASLGGEPLGLSFSANPNRLDELSSDLKWTWERLRRKEDEVEELVLGPVEVARQAQLRERIKIVPVWFNAWQYQDSALPVIGLLQEIRSQFSDLTKVADKAKKLGSVAVESGLNLIGQLIGAFASVRGLPELGGALRSAPGVGSTIRSVGESYEARNFEGLENGQRLSLLFEQAVGRLLGNDKEDEPENHEKPEKPAPERALRRLVIFIDDLDRCSEQQTLRLLEAIKLYLQSRNCVFVVGMDMAAARRAVQRGTGARDHEEAQEYLGKLFQTVLHVPVPRLTAQHTHKLLALLGAGSSDDRSGPHRACRGRCRPGRGQSSPGQELRQRTRGGLDGAQGARL